MCSSSCNAEEEFMKAITMVGGERLSMTMGIPHDDSVPCFSHSDA